MPDDTRQSTRYLAVEEATKLADKQLVTLKEIAMKKIMSGKKQPTRRVFQPCNQRIAGDIECCDGIVMDVDEYREGWQRDVIYQPHDCNPRFCATCSGTGEVPANIASDSDDCPNCEGTGWIGKPMWPRLRPIGPRRY